MPRPHAQAPCPGPYAQALCPWPDRVLFTIGHRSEELRVALGLAHFREQELHAFHRGERREHLAKHPHAIEILLHDEEFFLAGTALLDVDGGEHATIRELSIEVN